MVELEEASAGHPLSGLGYHLFEKLDLIAHFRLDERKLMAFFMEIEARTTRTTTGLGARLLPGAEGGKSGEDAGRARRPGAPAPVPALPFSLSPPSAGSRSSRARMDPAHSLELGNGPF